MSVIFEVNGQETTLDGEGFDESSDFVDTTKQISRSYGVKTGDVNVVREGSDSQEFIDPNEGNVPGDFENITKVIISQSHDLG